MHYNNSSWYWQIERERRRGEKRKKDVLSKNEHAFIYFSFLLETNGYKSWQLASSSVAVTMSVKQWFTKVRFGFDSGKENLRPSIYFCRNL